MAYIRILPPPFKVLLLQSMEVGAWAFMPLSYASESGAARICQRGGGGGVSPSHAGGFPLPGVGRFFENSCMKTTFSCTLLGVVNVVA